MTGRASPFAALTGAEKQIKWLEVQSVKLPYVQGSVDSSLEAAEEASTVRRQTEAPVKTTVSMNTPQPSRQRATPPQENNVGYTSTDFQKTRHRQYDAVIARMKQAELAAKQYHPLG